MVNKNKTFPLNNFFPTYPYLNPNPYPNLSATRRSWIPPMNRFTFTHKINISIIPSLPRFKGTAMNCMFDFVYSYLLAMASKERCFDLIIGFSPTPAVKS